MLFRIQEEKIRCKNAGYIKSQVKTKQSTSTNIKTKNI